MDNYVAGSGHGDVPARSTARDDMWAILTVAMIVLAVCFLVLGGIFGPKIQAMDAPKLLPVPPVHARSISLQTLAAQGKAREIATIYAPSHGDELWARATSGQLERVGSISPSQLLVWEPVVARLALTVVSAPPRSVIHADVVRAMNKKQLARGFGGPWSWALFVLPGAFIVAVLLFGVCLAMGGEAERKHSTDSAPEHCGTAQA